MFDIDGTLVHSSECDAQCLAHAVKDVIGIDMDRNWNNYVHVTDTGILSQVFANAQLVDDGSLAKQIKMRFIELLNSSIQAETLLEIAGANQFLQHLQSLDNVRVSLATGGWYESAIIKLRAAGIDCSDIPFASSNDHFARIEIMKIAAARSGAKGSESVIYFGDGAWDKKACEILGYDFVLVGDALRHQPQITDYRDLKSLSSIIGLNAHKA